MYYRALQNIWGALKSKAVLATVLLTATCFIAKAQQDAQFSQYVFNGLYINPAYAGYKQDTYLNAFYRSQWTGFQGAPQTLSVAADGAVNNNKVGLGLLLSQDRIGAQSNLAIYGNYAYRIQMGADENSNLAFGLGVGIVQNGIDGSKLYAAQADDSYIPTNFQRNILPDARVGVLYTTQNFFAGASVDNLVAHLIDSKKVSATMAPVPVPHYYLTAGTLFTLNDQTKLKTSFLLKDDHGGPTSLDLNAFILFNERLWVGGTYRTAVSLYNKGNLQNGLQKANAMVGTVEVFATERLRIGYSFDYSLTSLSNYSMGTHELSVGIYLKQSKTEQRTNRCYF